ncbi:MAG: 4-(cytidine 5'-diphospho)-2-C-methyl-D-erythritol kinase [Paludibacter sp.]|nr:4-(cytidine 5'-diphospho)-2-C-methyl-D-erythritol kinase [Paludibacter sp.]
MQLFPNAKINIGLNVVGKRPDGYHNIETVYYPIGLKDELYVAKSDIVYSRKVDYNLDVFGIEVTDDPGKNLVIKALHMLQKEHELPFVNIQLRKNIPSGAGLGGGSSDAAFMLKALNELFTLHLTDEELEKYAVKLGADCPYFIKNKPVFATGIGNEFSPVDLTLTGYHFVLVKPDVHVSTLEAYAAVTSHKPLKNLVESVKEPVEKWKDTIYNDFESAVFKKHPVIREIKEALYGQGAVYASMSGSGSSVYGLFKDIPDGLKMFDKYFTFVDSF